MTTDSKCSGKFLILSGSLRKDSLNGRLASLAAEVVRAKGGTVDQGDMRDFDSHSYDQDVETEKGIPEGASRFRERLVTSDAFIIASPEYNASMPGVLKNTIDWVSRFRPQPFNGKQGMLLSASPSMVGGNRGLWSLRVPLEHLGARIYPDMFSLAQAHEALDDRGRIKNAKLQNFFESSVGSFMDLVEAARNYPALKKQWIEFLGEHPNAATTRVESGDTLAAV